MSKTVKIILVVLGLLAVCGFLCAGGAYFWFQSNIDDLEKFGKESRDEAATFAEGRRDVECLDRSLQMALKCGELDIKCRTRANLFLSFCADAAEHTDEFCAGVPTPSSFTEEVKQTVAWSLAECERRGHANEQMCTDHVKEVVNVCKTRRR